MYGLISGRYIEKWYRKGSNIVQGLFYIALWFKLEFKRLDMYCIILKILRAWLVSVFWEYLKGSRYN